MTKYNHTIRIYRTDIEKMKTQIGLRMSHVWYIYNHHLDVEEYYRKYYPEEYVGEYFSPQEIWVEICKTHFLCKKADEFLADTSFDFMYVDADEWFEEWNLEEFSGEYLIDKYYMFPDSDEVDEIFEKLKSNYKYTVEDLFGVYRLYSIDENTVVA